MARLGGNPQLKKVRNEDTRAANSKRRALADDYSLNRLLKYLSTRRLPESQYYPIPCVA